MGTIEFFDLHCHFLPGMDDGCKTPEESVRLLEEQYRQGCRGVAATPHYYAVESIESFLARRKQAAGRLLAELRARSPVAIPNICFGAEVAFRETLESEQELERLCYGKSRYLLLEMPFTPWTDPQDEMDKILNELERTGCYPDSFTAYETFSEMENTFSFDVTVLHLPRGKVAGHTWYIFDETVNDYVQG